MKKAIIKVFINPGSGKVESGSQEQSEINIQKFIEDLGIKAEYEFKSIGKDGRHIYEVRIENVCVFKIMMYICRGIK